MKVNRKTGEWISSAILNLSSDTLPHSAKLFLNPKNLNSVQAPKMLNLGDQSVIGSWSLALGVLPAGKGKDCGLP